MKKYIVLLITSLLTLIASSCMEDTTVVWEGIQVEFAKATGGSGNIYLRRGDGTTETDFVRINLVAAHQTNPIAVNWEVDAASTAIEGVHYRLVSASPAVIPAGESWIDVEFEIIPDNIEPGEVWDLVFSIAGSDVDVSENEKSVTHSIEISCPINAPFTGDYQLETTVLGIFGTPTFTDGVVTLSEVDGDPLSRTFEVRPYPSFGVFNPVTVTLSLVCGSVKVASFETGVGCAGSTVVGAPTIEGTYDFEDDSAITINFTDDVDVDCSTGGGPIQAQFTLTKL